MNTRSKLDSNKESRDPWIGEDFGGLPDARLGYHDCNAHAALDAHKHETYCAVCGRVLLALVTTCTRDGAKTEPPSGARSKRSQARFATGERGA